MSTRLLLLMIVLIVEGGLLSGCGQTLYLAKLGWQQVHISSHSIPIQEVLEGEGGDAEIREKIRFIQDVKRYGEETLGLKRSESYSTFYEINGPVLFVVTASEKDRLQLCSWSFPIVGRVTYKGYFEKRDALREQQRLDRKGYDSYLQPSEAYSTLGWFKDPIFSSMLKWDPDSLTNLILHEMAHSTVYFENSTDFSEQMATFIGNQGTVDFMRERHGPGSKEVLNAIARHEDDRLFSRWVGRAHERLSKLYGQPIPKEEKLIEREAVFRSVQEDFRKIKPELKTEAYQRVDRIPLNNAVLLSFRQYFDRLETFEAVYAHFGGNWRRFMALMRTVRASGEDPSRYLERWMEKRTITVSASPR